MRLALPTLLSLATMVAARPVRRRSGVGLALVLLASLSLGCGISKSRLATDQLVVADAVDEAVSKIDFTPLTGKTVFLDTTMLDDLKMTPHGNVEYVIGSLRQQMVAYNCLLQEKRETAEFVVEARLGALANDNNEVTYGIPGNNAVKTAASVVPNFGTAASLVPELSIGRRTHQLGAAKIGIFAYDRATREPVWQAGLSTGTSEARDLWLLGLGPFQKGRIYRRMDEDTLARAISDVSDDSTPAMKAYTQSVTFARAEKALPPVVAAEVTPTGTQANHQTPVAGK